MFHHVLKTKNGNLQEWMEKKTSEGLTALLIAAKKNYRIIELLVSHGANIHAQDNHGCGVLHISTNEEMPLNIAIFLKMGVDINMISQDSKTALHLASNQSSYN